ncbi:hypothetical protein BDV28DRAFT_131648 [Aspergillus coremiiformis]|uniref:Uncharacterized protein n=1 Tax=Aspergillus coremiiformis TaxID=138285 RepID=A0A5N6Z8Y4_9EURO|nr:hypothetical protein BDV28DRAFT_131648 [Aspergillus coremiiformis]
MAKAQHEISQIISSLITIIWKHTDTLGIPQRPQDHDWDVMREYVSRLLILRGMTQAGSTLPEDPWDFILSEFGPASARQLSTSHDSNSPRSILLRPGNGTSLHSPSGYHVHFQDPPAGCVRRRRGHGSVARSTT